ncbi:MAG: MBL fold metallo-hydrolase [archaeon]
MIKEITKNIWQISFDIFGSVVYFLKLSNKNIIIDTSTSQNSFELIRELKSIGISPEDIDIVILTHNHYDHIDNNSLFEKAKFYASKEDFKDEKILNIYDLGMPQLEVIKTPGHTIGGICLLLKKEKILFSGDTIFHNGYIGRTDLPTSSPEQMAESLKKLNKIGYKILCPGHLY